MIASFVNKSSPANAILPIVNLKLINNEPAFTFFIFSAALSDMYSFVSKIIFPSLREISAMDTHLLFVIFDLSHEDESPLGGVFPMLIEN